MKLGMRKIWIYGARSTAIASSRATPERWCLAWPFWSPTSVMSLQSGDVISTGTPPGVGLGQKPPRYLRTGQTMRLGITGLGIQEQRTVLATRAQQHR